MNLQMHGMSRTSTSFTTIVAKREITGRNMNDRIYKIKIVLRFNKTNFRPFRVLR